MKKIILLIAFIATAIGAQSQNVTRGEYFVDTDPGFGKATSFSVSPQDTDIMQAITIPYSAFTTPGYHSLFIRTLDANGSWSITARKIVYVDDNVNPLNVVRGEYFIDTDPGFGKATSFAITPGDTDIAQAINIPYSAFTNPGYHSVFIRTIDTKGDWSITARKIIYVDDNVNPLNVVRGEYFIDTDPGFGKATSFAITPQDTDIAQAINIPYSAFTNPGYHSVFIRTIDTKGDWGITARKIVEVADTTNPLTVIKVEYFFKTDNGFGGNSSVQLTPSTDSTWVFNIPSNQLPAKLTNDTLFLRVKENSHDNWALTTAVDSLNLVLAKTITTGTIMGSPFCACTAVNVPFTCSGKFNAGNIYTAQLSDSTGNFSVAVTIGTLSGTDSIGTIAATIPCNTLTGDKYRIRVMGSNFVTTGLDNGSNITINAPPVINVLPASICFGTSDTLTASGASTYTWTPSTGLSATTGASVIAGPGATTTYTVIGKDANNCTATAQPTITVNPLPATPVIKQINDSTLTDSTTASSYQWYFNGTYITGATEQTYVASKAANYRLIVTNAFGCESDSSNLIDVVYTSVSKLTSSGIISIYPNPFSENITVNVHSGEAVQLIIYNILGEIVVNKLLDKTTDIDLSVLPAGLFMAVVNRNNDIIYKAQLVKQ